MWQRFCFVRSMSRGSYETHKISGVGISHRIYVCVLGDPGGGYCSYLFHGCRTSETTITNWIEYKKRAEDGWKKDPARKRERAPEMVKSPWRPAIVHVFLPPIFRTDRCQLHSEARKQAKQVVGSNDVFHRLPIFIWVDLFLYRLRIYGFREKTNKLFPVSFQVNYYSKN